MPSPAPTATPPTVPIAPPAGGRRPSPARVVGALATGLLAALVLVATYALAVLDPTGRRVDDAVMTTAMRVGQAWRGTMLELLDVVAVPTVALAVLALVALALARGRADRAGGIAALVLGSQLVTQVLKAVLPRAGDPEGNSLPSGHTTLVVALGVALVIALPRSLRPVAVLAAAATTGLVGVATMVTGWHRPSDLVAAVAVVAGVAAALRLVEELRPGPADRTGPSDRTGPPAQTSPAGARASTTWSR